MYLQNKLSEVFKMNELTNKQNNIETQNFSNTLQYTNSLTPKTKASYVSTIKEFFCVSDLSQITIQQLQSVTPDIANMWAKQLIESKQCKPSSVNQKLGALQNFYSYLCRHSVRICAYNPFSTNEGCIRFKNATKNYSDKRALSKTEIKNIFDAVEFPTSKYSPKWLVAQRDLIILQLLATTGMRRGELLSITIGDLLKVEDKHVCEIVGKGNKKRLIVVPEKVHENILLYIKARGLSLTDKEKPLLTSHSSNAEPDSFLNSVTIYRVVKKYADKAGLAVDDISPHNFRHTFCTQSIELGADLNTVCDLMGHQSVSTTKRYEHTLRVIKGSTSESLSNLYEL